MARQAVLSQRKSKWTQVLNRIPQLINRARLQWKSSKHALNARSTVDHEPLRLQVFANTPYYPESAAQGVVALPTLRNGEKLDLESFRFILDQVPAVQSVEFCGQGEPLLLPDVFKMIELAASFNGAHTTLVSDGFLLGARLQHLLHSPLERLVVRAHAHRPSAYANVTGRAPQEFGILLEQLKLLLKARAELQSPLQVYLQMTVDIHNCNEVPEILAFCESLNVDGVIFENYLGEDPFALSDRTLFSDQTPIMRFLQGVAERSRRNSPLDIIWPVVLDQTLIGAPGRCEEPFTMVGVGADCSVSGCSRQLIEPGEGDKIWEADFWNSPTYQILRKANDGTTELPPPCMVCPKNIGTNFLNEC